MKIKKNLGFREAYDPKFLSVLGVGFGAILYAIGYYLFLSIPFLYGVFTFLAVFSALIMPISYKYSEFKRTREIEKAFPRFLSDINENINSGMSLPQAIRATKGIDYGAMTPYVNDIINKLNWGINFDTILKNFAKATRSPVIIRSVRTINEAHKSGGKIGTVMEAVSRSVQTIEQIKKERTTRIYSQMINGYFIFFIFLGVIFGLSKFLIPSFQFQGTVAGLEEILKNIFRNLILIQGFFGGLAIGKMAEGSFVEGLKHSLILIIIGYSIILFML